MFVLSWLGIVPDIIPGGAYTNSMKQALLYLE